MRTKKKRSVDFTTKMNETKMCSNFVEHSKYTTMEQKKSTERKKRVLAWPNWRVGTLFEKEKKRELDKISRQQ